MYNENDPGAVEWLSKLQSRGLIAKGDIDGRSIEELRGGDCGSTSHFFAGIGGWAYALQLAGWDPARPVWTGSCPCQPFSTSGAKRGFSDSKHLWPAWYELIKECRPAVVFGEQTASALGREWLSRVRADLEELGYAFGAADLCAAGINAPHRRQRLYWVAHAGHLVRDEASGFRGAAPGFVGASGADEGSGEVRGDEAGFWSESDVADGGEVGIGADFLDDSVRGGSGNPDYASEPRGYREEDGLSEPSGLSDFWGEFDVAECRGVDGSVQYRRIGPGVLPVADGVPERVGRIRGYGNAVVPQLAAVFIRSFMEAAGYMSGVARSGWAIDIQPGEVVEIS